MKHDSVIRWEKRWLNGKSHEEYRIMCQTCPWMDKAANKSDAEHLRKQHKENPRAWKACLESY